jgi:signal recognition particle subunit SRP54
MLRSLTKGLSNVFSKIAGKKSIDANAFESILKGIRDSLLDSDVALEVAEHLISCIRSTSNQKGVFSSEDASGLFMQIVKDELIALISDDKGSSFLDFKNVPFNIMMIGNHGSGKTTSSGKIAHYIKKQKQKSVLLVSLDIVRPAAQQQLSILANLASVDFFTPENLSIDQICDDALEYAKKKGHQVIIYDTVGSSHTDTDALNNLLYIKQKICPEEVLLVADALTGQDSIKLAKSFTDGVGISGVILAKMDSDARGAGALSIRYVTKKSVKFIGTGEDVKDLELFDPKSIVLRILDMGDIEALTKKLEDVVDVQTREKELQKIQSGKFTLEDYESHIVKISKMGGLSKIAGFLPGASKLLDSPAFKGGADKMLIRQQSIIRSMTPKERKRPQILTHSRKKRIASGSGRTIAEVDALLKQFQQMSSLIKLGPKALLKSGQRLF